MTMMSVVVSMVISSLCLKDILDLTDLFLNFAGYLFTGIFGFLLQLVRLMLYFPNDLFCFCTDIGINILCILQNIPPFLLHIRPQFFAGFGCEENARQRAQRASNQ